MRLILLSIVLTAIGWSQSIAEFGAAAAGGAVGGAAGKKVSDGLTNILDKIDQHTTAAAASPAPKTATSVPPAPPLLQVSPGVPIGSVPASVPAAAPSSRAPVARAAVTESVPPPPPIPGERVKRAAPPQRVPPPVVVVAVPPPPPPPPPVTPDDLRDITQGESRADVLKLGAPAARITMFDDGHLLELFRYMAGDTTFGVVRVIDGAVSTVDLRR